MSLSNYCVETFVWLKSHCHLTKNIFSLQNHRACCTVTHLANVPQYSMCVSVGLCARTLSIYSQQKSVFVYL